MKRSLNVKRVVKLFESAHNCTIKRTHGGYRFEAVYSTGLTAELSLNFICDVVRDFILNRVDTFESEAEYAGYCGNLGEEAFYSQCAKNWDKELDICGIRRL